MNKNTLVVLTVLGVAFFAGCGQKEKPQTGQTGSEKPAVSLSMPSQAGIVEATAPDKRASRVSPIEYAQKEYLDAYNDYVRLLRESGPQTIETLQALTVYQKKYQIYQMLLKAEGDKKP